MTVRIKLRLKHVLRLIFQHYISVFWAKKSKDSILFGNRFLEVTANHSKKKTFSACFHWNFEQLLNCNNLQVSEVGRPPCLFYRIWCLKHKFQQHT